jgi:hypothetical protein
VTATLPAIRAADLHLDAVRFAMAPALRRAGLDSALVAGCAGLALADAPVATTAGATVVPHELLARAGLTVLRYDTAGCCPPALRLALAETGRDLLGAAVGWCRDFLGARRSGDQRLSAHPQVAHQLAALVARAAALRQVDLPGTLDDPAGRAWWVREVDELAYGLIRMAGGRSVLSGQMVQLRTALLYANRIYLGGTPCRP